jgi:hypothetical protein
MVTKPSGIDEDKPNARPNTRGGDHQHRQRVGTTDLHFAHELLRAMLNAEAPWTAEFRQEWDSLYARWRRWAKAAQRFADAVSAGMEVHDLRNQKKFFETIKFHRVEYPTPRSLTSEQFVQIRQLERICDAASQAWFRSFPHDGHGERYLPYRAALRATNRVYDLVYERNKLFNPGRRTRTSNRLASRYNAEVAQFCLKWGLVAWWAAPAVIESHFSRAELGIAEPLWVRVHEAFVVETFPIVITLPDRSPDDAAADRERLATAFYETFYGDGEHRLRVTWFPDRDEMRRLEIDDDAAAVILEWNGADRQFLKSGTAANPLSWVVEECELRLGRLLKKRERLAVSAEAAPQFVEGSRWFLDNGHFEVRPRGDMDLHARWVAQKLLVPSMTYGGLGSYGDDERAIRRACKVFAQRAAILWPPIR